MSVPKCGMWPDRFYICHFHPRHGMDNTHVGYLRRSLWDCLAHNWIQLKFMVKWIMDYVNLSLKNKGYISGEFNLTKVDRGRRTRKIFFARFNDDVLQSGTITTSNTSRVSTLTLQVKCIIGEDGNKAKPHTRWR